MDAARKEMQQLASIFRRANGRKPKFPFKAYRTPALVKLLEETFHKKCAYCEGTYAATSYVEIEHYRPKKLYYWLAAEWSNLLPACKRCNNGKLSKFPLVDQRKQARRKGQEKLEQPLLLNPCDCQISRRPERHLAFAVDDGAIRATTSKGKPSLFGTTSIQIYRLDRTDLSQERKKWALRVKQQILHCKLALRAGTADDQEAAYQGLREFLGPGQPFRALTVEIIRQSGITTGR